MAFETLGILGQEHSPEYGYVQTKPRTETATEVSSAYPLSTPLRSAVAYTTVLKMPQLGGLGVELAYQFGWAEVLASAEGMVRALAAQSILDELLDQTYRRMDGFLDLRSDWYFHGAHEISPATVTTAKQLLGSLRDLSYEMGKRVVPYGVAPLVTGGIQLEWRGDRGSLEVEIGAQGNPTYLLDTGQGHENEGDLTPADKLPDLLRRIL
ncbi:MAG TPA: hypothetical protein VKT83_07260 [bacterium]|nr:hypothetical protein [bacterium]